MIAITTSLVSALVPLGSVHAADGATYELSISWTRPGVEGTLGPPAALRVGDEVTITPSVGGASLAGVWCHVVFFSGTVEEASARFMEANWIGCAGSWTFVLPPSPLGTYSYSGYLVGATTADGEVPRVPVTSVDVETGVARPFSSNFAHLSWAQSDLVGAGELHHGEPFTVAAPVGEWCEFMLHGAYRHHSMYRPNCEPLTLTLPRFASEWEANDSWEGLFWVNATRGDWNAQEAGASYAGTRSTGIVIGPEAEGSAAPFASSVPAGNFEPSRNPRFVYTGQLYAVDVTVVNLASGSCELMLHTEGIDHWVPIVDGHCTDSDYTSSAAGFVPVSALIYDSAGNRVADADLYLNAIDPLPPPEIDAPAETPEDAPVAIDVAVDTGAPTDWSVSIAPESATITAAAATTFSGVLDPSLRSGEATVHWDPAAPGRYRVTTTFGDVTGRTRSSSRVITAVGPSLPTVSGPWERFVVSGTVGSTLPVRINWAGQDPDDAIVRYQIQESLDSGSFVTVALPTPTAKAITRALPPAHPVRYRVRALDAAGHWGSWSYGPTFTPRVTQDGGSSIGYAGGWNLWETTSAWGGTARYSRTAGAVARRTFVGRDLAIVAPVGPNRGQVDVVVDGVTRRMDLYAPTLACRRIVFERSWGTVGTHTIALRVVGTPDRPRFDLDAILVLG